MFADDATFITDGSKNSIEAVVKNIDTFSLLSGLKLNRKKTFSIRCGSLKHTNFICCEEKQFNWTSEKASTLGMTFTNDKNDMTINDLLPKLKQFTECLDRWKRHNLTPIGKISVIKTFALPKLIYPLTILQLPDKNIIKEINDKMFQFLWDGKPDKIKRNLIIQDYSKGGLKMVEIYSYINSLKIKCIKRILDKENKGNWREIYKKDLDKLDGDLIF